MLPLPPRLLVWEQRGPQVLVLLRHNCKPTKPACPNRFYNLTGVIPFTETIFLPQSMIMTVVLIIASIAIAFWSAPKGQDIKTIDQFPIQFEEENKPTATTKRPGDWLENSPLLSILIVLLGLVWMFNEFSKSNPILAISSLNTYNFIFLMLGIALHGTPRNFLNAVTKAVPTVSGVLIQFPLYGKYRLYDDASLEQS